VGRTVLMRCALALALLLAVTGDGLAEATQLGSDHWVRQRAERSVRPGVTLLQVRQQMRLHFFNSGPDGGGVSATTYEVAEARGRAQARAAQIELLLALDLDGDGVATRQEMETVARRKALRQAAHRLASSDNPPAVWRRVDRTVTRDVESWVARGRDGALTIAGMLQAAERLRQEEAARFVRSDPHSPQERRQMRLEQIVPLGLDADHDGTVSLAEYDAAVAAIFHEYDDDGDGTISAAEAQGHNGHAASLRQAALQAIKVADCAFPPIPTDVRTLLFSTHRGVSLATIGAGDDLTEVAEIVIEPGRDRLALVLQGPRAMIWIIKGARERIDRVVLAAHAGNKPYLPPRGGVVGLSRERVFFAGRSDCIGGTGAPVLRAEAAAALAALIGRPGGAVLHEDRAGSVLLPSGRNREDVRLDRAMPLPRGEPAASLYRTLLDDHAGGLVAIDPQEVVSPGLLRRHSILPLDAGLAQLIDEGALTITGYQEGIVFQPDGPRPYRRPNMFRVERKILLPPGLTHRRLVFMLAPGVTMPDGDIGQSCVMTEAGNVLANFEACPDP
jgi:hypothetical protein